jgi:ABC-2 type transport system ATP-binding protein
MVCICNLRFGVIHIGDMQVKVYLQNQFETNMTSVLSIKQLTKFYGRIQALNNVSFDVPKGSVFGILGPNGSGKTTLLSIILDVLKANNGDFHWFGQPGSPEQRKKIGSLLETPNFYHYMSATDNLKITKSISGRGSDEDIDNVLKKVKLFERKKSRFSTYSLGMKQRLAIAGALLGNPSVLVLDEPTNGLDPVGIAEIRELIVALKDAGHTIIMASHLLDEVEKVCTHVVILKTGNVVATGAVEEVMKDEDMVELGATDLEALALALKEIGKNIQINRQTNTVQMNLANGTARLEEINRYCFEKGITLNHLILKKKRLEARFFELTNN